MRSNKVYAPLWALTEFEKSFPRIYETYENNVLKRTSGVMERDIAVALAKVSVAYMSGKSVDKLRSKKDDILELANLILVYCSWKKYKQVYTFSKELYEMMKDCECETIDSTIFQNLPYTSFYFEVPGSNIFEGVFVKYIHDEINTGFVFLLLMKNENFCVIPINLDETRNIKEFLNVSSYVNIDKNAAIETINFAIQACMYLCAKNCDIVENEEQRQIYRPNISNKNRYSEVRKWDVGYRVARDCTRIRKSQSCWQEDKNMPVEKRRLRQHWRRAHWHTYHVGPKGERTEIKFIAPILVNDIGDNLPIVEHPN